MTYLLESGGVREQEVASCGVVDVSTVEALDHELAWESEVLAHFDRLFVDDLRCEVLCDAAVVNVAQLILVVLVVEQIVHIDVVYVALDRLKIHVVFIISFFAAFTAFATLFASAFSIFSLVIVLVVFVFGLALHLVGLFEPSVGQDLRDRQALYWLKLYHASNQVLCIL